VPAKVGTPGSVPTFQSMPSGFSQLRFALMNAQTPCSLLIVADEPYIRASLAALTGNAFEFLATDSGEAAQQIFAPRGVDLILADQKLPGMSGVQILEWVRVGSPKTVRLLMTGFAELEGAVEAINRGKVHAYLFKPWRAEELLETLGGAARTFHRQRQYE